MSHWLSLKEVKRSNRQHATNRKNKQNCQKRRPIFVIMIGQSSNKMIKGNRFGKRTLKREPRFENLIRTPTPSPNNNNKQQTLQKIQEEFVVTCKISECINEYKQRANISATKTSCKNTFWNVIN